MAANNSGETATRVRGRPFAPGNSGNPRGRPRGTPNKVTTDAREAASQIVDSPAYRARLMERALAGELHAGLEALLWAYSKGKPRDVGFSGSDVRELVQHLVGLALSVARTDDDRRRVALEIMRLRRAMDAPLELPALNMSADDEVIFVDEVIA